MKFIRELFIVIETWGLENVDLITNDLTYSSPATKMCDCLTTDRACLGQSFISEEAIQFPFGLREALPVNGIHKEHNCIHLRGKKDLLTSIDLRKPPHRRCSIKI